jgi:hypothetical protein
MFKHAEAQARATLKYMNPRLVSVIILVTVAPFVNCPSDHQHLPERLLTELDLFNKPKIAVGLSGTSSVTIHQVSPAIKETTNVRIAR